MNVFRIGDKNPKIGKRVTVTWLRAWGGYPVGHKVTGTLLSTFCVNGGRTLIGEVKTRAGKVISCPWSRNFLTVK